jgi:hypothetical protein
MFTFYGLTGRGTLERVAIDHKFWFAKLYELITYFEILESDRFTHPEFVLHFVPIFYNMYYDALQHYLNRQLDQVSALWLQHFQTASRPFADSFRQYLSDISDSIITGVSAHINGDMASALEQAYRSFVARYCVQNVPFNEYRRDFFENNRPIFERVKAEFLLVLARLGPFPVRPEVGQFIIAGGEQSGVAPLAGARGLDVNEVYRWRATAWSTALSRLGQ